MLLAGRSPPRTCGDPALKKVILIVLGLGLVGATVAIVTGIQLRNPWLDGEREKVSRGHMVIPVTASGVVQPDEFITIKSKAGGIVSSIPVVAGKMVVAGEILLELDPIDETRNVEAREADMKRFKALLEQSNIRLRNAKTELPLLTKIAKARLDDAIGRRKDAEWNWTRIEELKAGDNTATSEVSAIEAARVSARANVDLLEAEHERAQNNQIIQLSSAEQDVIQAEASMTAAQKALDEAKLRLSETTVRAPKDAMVYSIMVKEREAIQSGTQSFTGGTPLMVLANVKSMFVQAQVDEADIGSIRQIAPDYAKPGKTTKLSEDEYQRIAREIMDAAKAEAESKAIDEKIQTLMHRPVEVTVEAFQRDTYRGVIERIEPEPQLVNNVLAFKVRIRLVGEDLEKLLGLQADLSFTTQKLDNVLRVKNEALVSEGRDCFVYVPKRDNPRAPWDEEKKQVKIGATDGTYTEIVSGLNEGDEVWTKRPKKTDKEKEQQQET